MAYRELHMVELRGVLRCSNRCPVPIFDCYGVE